MTNNWKLIEILNQLKDAGLPEMIYVHYAPENHWVDINWAKGSRKHFFTKHFISEKYPTEEYRVNGYSYGDLPTAIAKLKQLLQTEGKDE